jgi:pantetheine-phosphate adenylyltransferase
MYTHIVVGGTFDTLHRGHIHVLTRAFSLAKKVTIGLTSEAYIRRFKKDSGVSPFSIRYRALTTWLRTNGYADRVTIVSLDNKWGPVLLPDGFDSLIVTQQNKETGVEINTIRKERGLAPLTLVEIDLITAEDNKPISSTRIRNKEIDRKGALHLPDNLRSELQKPFGQIIANHECKEHILSHKDGITISVGDVTTETVFYCGVQPSLIIIDLHVERKPYQPLAAYKLPKKYSIIKVQSGPGYISKDAMKSIALWKSGIRNRKRVALVIDGEEDLLVLPVIQAAPIGSVVYYGSPPISGTEGLVEVIVTKEIKQKVKEIMLSFTT